MLAHPQCRKIADCFYFQTSKFIFEICLSSHEILEVFVGKGRYSLIKQFVFLFHLIMQRIDSGRGGLITSTQIRRLPREVNLMGL